ncbi:MAG: O-antigen ligase family protein [Bacteroidetes bacterium]|nr:O-antigen ligase family protein [Bacteroidota bacterium]MCL1969095.1 O-antigen ligase family protein [Bacteroidota bacterium]
MFKKCCNLLITNWKENLYLLSLGALLVALPTSIALISCTSVALLIVWILTGDYKTKWNRLIHNKNAMLLMSIPVIYLIGLFFTHNFLLGIQEFNKSLYWFIFAFVLGSSAPISQQNTRRLLGIYILTVTVAAGAALLKLWFVDTVFFSDFRQVTWINHIPFSYQMAFVIWLIFYFMVYGNILWLKKSLLFLLILFLIIALFALKSFNGYLYFGIMSFTALLFLIWKTKKRVLKFVLLGCVILISILPVFYVYHCVQKFYDVTEYNATEIEQYTVNGNKYEHNFKDKTKENGNYTGLFLCEEELIPLWDAHSCKAYYSKTANGYPFRCVIVRYMTSKGLTKDSAGFAQLSQKDIENIENEIPNYIYAENKLGVYPRIYETIWEYDQYRIDKDPNAKSFVQRIELVRLAGNIIKKHIWTGIGLGNNAQAYEDIILESKSQLGYQQTGSSHNQYLNYLIRFGILGTLYILGILTYVFIKGRKNNPFLITIFFVSMLVANFGDANWETFIGINYFAFFICFLMWLSPKEIFTA